jgi:hypothetical protein
MLGREELMVELRMIITVMRRTKAFLDCEK